MKEVVRIKLENEMDLILAHKRSMKLADLCGMSSILQTSYGTAVSEISRCVIGRDKKSELSLSISLIKAGRKFLVATIITNDQIGKEHQNALRYAERLAGTIKVEEKAGRTEFTITRAIVYSGLLNDTKIESFVKYFKTELPLSPYDELRKKNIQLLDLSEKLKESEVQYRRLTETLPLMMITTNSAGHIIFANRWYKNYFNFSEVPSGQVHWLSAIDIIDAHRVRSEWEKSSSLSQAFSMEARLKPRISHDTAAWHIISLVAIKNENAVLSGWTGFFVDISAQKLVEETLKNNSELKYVQKQLLTSQTRLEEKLAELNKSNHDLEQFAYIASHDLQEPIRKIRNFIDLLRKNLDDSEKAERYMERIDDSSARMIALIKAVLNYSRLSKSDASFENVDLNKILNAVTGDLELIIEEKKAKILSDPLPTIMGLEQQLYQLFYNLINNSLKFSQDSTVIQLQLKELDYEEVKKEELHTSVKYIQITFVDNGIGFEQKYANQIFTIFKRLNGKDQYAGTGIGLALCKKIVENHHGRISANSKASEGAEFKIILPVT